MRLLILLLGVLGALILHERLVRRPPGLARSAARFVLLLCALGATAVAAPLLRDRLSSWLDDDHVALAVPFDSTGDPLGSKALATQHPAHPFPSSGSAAAVSSWQDGIRQT